MRLSELSALKDGWLDGEGVALQKEFLMWLDKCFEDKYPSTLPLPHLFPMPNGGISAEWFEHEHECRCDTVLEINPDHSGSIYCDEDENGKTINLDENGWQQVSNCISDLNEGILDAQ